MKEIDKALRNFIWCEPKDVPYLIDLNNNLKSFVVIMTPKNKAYFGHKGMDKELKRKCDEYGEGSIFDRDVPPNRNIIITSADDLDIMLRINFECSYQAISEKVRTALIETVKDYRKNCEWDGNDIIDGVYKVSGTIQDVLGHDCVFAIHVSLTDSKEEIDKIGLEYAEGKIPSYINALKNEFLESFIQRLKEE